MLTKNDLERKADECLKRLNEFPQRDKSDVKSNFHNDGIPNLVNVLNCYLKLVKKSDKAESKYLVGIENSINTLNRYLSLMDRFPDYAEKELYGYCFPDLTEVEIDKRGNHNSFLDFYVTKSEERLTR